MLVSWNTTRACNLKCPHCYRDAGEKAPRELDFAEAQELLRQLREAGFRVLVFSGGEPLLRPDLLALVREARTLGLRPVLGTNGTLITRAVARSLKEAGVEAVGISIDSLCQERHDAFRGVPGAWKAAVAGLENCRAAGISVQVHTTVFPWNRAEVLEITRFAASLGARGHHVFFFVPTGRGREEEALGPEETEELLGELVRAQERFPLELKPTCAPQFLRHARQLRVKTRYRRGCLAGISYCVVGPEGDVYPCPYLDLKVGNVRAAPFSAIWRESPVLRALRAQRYSGYCGACAYRRVCGGCRARAFAATGDYLAGDPSCSYARERTGELLSFAPELLARLQQGLPLTPRPFQALAAELGVGERQLLEALRWLRAEGVLRHLGAAWDSSRLGLVSTLCAARVAPARVEEVAAFVNSCPGVTHNYLREHPYNLWFTVAARTPEEIASFLARVRSLEGVEEVLDLRALQRYKAEVVFAKEEIARALGCRTAGV